MPGIGDRALNISDTYLHFVYNIVAYAGTVTPFWFIYKRRVASGTEFAYRRSS